MKKIVLSLMFIISCLLCVIPVHASFGDITVSTSTDVTTVYPGDEFTFTVSIDYDSSGGGYSPNITGFWVKLKSGNGLTIKNVVGAKGAYAQEYDDYWRVGKGSEYSNYYDLPSYKDFAIVTVTVDDDVTFETKSLDLFEVRIVKDGKTKSYSEDFSSVTVKKGTFTGLLFNDADYIYDGFEKSISVIGVPIGATVIYSSSDTEGNKATDAGTYKIKATVSKQGFYDWSSTKTLTISPRDISTAQVNLGAQLIYNGAYQNQSIRSVMIDGVNILPLCDVTNDRQKEPGEYTLSVMPKASSTNYTGSVCKTYVIEPIITGVSLNKNAISLFVDESTILTATISPDNATNKTALWSSSNESVAKVDANGKVTGVSSGTATITATSFDGKHSDSCVVTVEADSVPEVYNINSITLKDMSGNEISSIPTGIFLATISFTNVNSCEDTVIVLAQYTANGVFKGLMYIQTEDVPIGSTIKLSIPVDNTSGDIAKLKAFCWESFGSLTPMGNSASFPAE